MMRTPSAKMTSAARKLWGYRVFAEFTSRSTLRWQRKGREKRLNAINHLKDVFCCCLFEVRQRHLRLLRLRRLVWQPLKASQSVQRLAQFYIYSLRPGTRRQALYRFGWYLAVPVAVLARGKAAIASLLAIHQQRRRLDSLKYFRCLVGSSTRQAFGRRSAPLVVNKWHQFILLFKVVMQTNKFRPRLSRAAARVPKRFLFKIYGPALPPYPFYIEVWAVVRAILAPVKLVLFKLLRLLSLALCPWRLIPVCVRYLVKQMREAQEKNKSQHSVPPQSSTTAPTNMTKLDSKPSLRRSTAAPVNTKKPVQTAKSSDPACRVKPKLGPEKTSSVRAPAQARAGVVSSTAAPKVKTEEKKQQSSVPLKSNVSCLKPSLASRSVPNVAVGINPSQPGTVARAGGATPLTVAKLGPEKMSGIKKPTGEVGAGGANAAGVAASRAVTKTKKPGA